MHFAKHQTGPLKLHQTANLGDDGCRNFAFLHSNNVLVTHVLFVSSVCHIPISPSHPHPAFFYFPIYFRLTTWLAKGSTPLVPFRAWSPISPTLSPPTPTDFAFFLRGTAWESFFFFFELWRCFTYLNFFVNVPPLCLGKPCSFPTL